MLPASEQSPTSLCHSLVPHTTTQLPSYSEQFNKITEAYIRGEIKLFNENFCFCGTLANGDNWAHNFHYVPLDYSYGEFGEMERALFSAFPSLTWKDNAVLHGLFPSESSPDFEDNLFSGMCAALEVLRKIHEERGEVIDDAPVFTKRKLQTV